MIEQMPPRNERDFAIGFFGCLCAGIIYLIISLAPILLIIIAIAGAIIASIIAFKRQRKFIGIGILTATVVVPLLLAGSCFAIVYSLDF